MPSEQILNCRSCGKLFCWSTEEQAFFRERGLKRPGRCPACRKARRELARQREPGEPPLPSLPRRRLAAIFTERGDGARKRQRDGQNTLVGLSKLNALGRRLRGVSGG